MAFAEDGLLIQSEHDNISTISIEHKARRISSSWSLLCVANQGTSSVKGEEIEVVSFGKYI